VSICRCYAVIKNQEIFKKHEYNLKEKKKNGKH